MSEKTRVMMVETGGWGGIHHYAHALCDALHRGGEVRVGLLSNQRHELAEGDYPVHRFFTRENYAQTLWRLWRLLRRERPDILHFQSLLAPRKDLALFGLCRRLGIRPVMTVHNVLPHETRWGEAAVYGAYYRRSAGLIVHSRANAQTLRERFPRIRAERVAVVPHGNYDQFRHYEVERAEARRRLGLPAAGRMALFLGTLRPYKGFDLFLQAAAAAAPACPEAFFVAAGPVLYGQQEDYERMVARSGLDAARLEARFAYQSNEDVVAYICASDVVVLPYRHIYQSGVLFMAYSFGRPVLATRVGSFPESVEDGRSGWLVEPGDVQGLAERLVRVLGPGEAAARAGAYARDLAEASYGWDGIAAQTAAVYARAVEGA